MVGDGRGEDPTICLRAPPPTSCPSHDPFNWVQQDPTAYAHLLTPNPPRTSPSASNPPARDTKASHVNMPTLRGPPRHAEEISVNGCKRAPMSPRTRSLGHAVMYVIEYPIYHTVKVGLIRVRYPVWYSGRLLPFPLPSQGGCTTPLLAERANQHH